MFKEITKCSLCGDVQPRDQLIIYHFPNGSKLVCKRCYQRLPPDKFKDFKQPPNKDIFPPREY